MHRFQCFVVLAAFVWIFQIPTEVHAGIKAEAAREAAELISKRFAAETVKESAETLAVRLESLAVKHGDEVFAIARKSGPKAIRAVEQAGENAPTALRMLGRYGDEAISVVSQPKSLALAARYGDDAAEALIRHPGVAEEAIEGFGKSAATALKSLDGQNARRLAMLADEGTLAKMSRRDELLGVAGKYGNRAMDFIWRNKGTLALSAALVAFLNDPEPFINGTKDLAKVVGENIAQPIADQAARSFPWSTFYLVALVLGIAGTLWILRTRIGVIVWRKLRGDAAGSR